MKKASEGRDGAAILSLNVSPQNLRCGSRTVVKQARLPPVDVQVLGGFPRDRDSEDVRKQAEEHLEEDQELDAAGKLNNNNNNNNNNNDKENQNKQWRVRLWKVVYK